MFGVSLTCIGDLVGDSVVDIAVGAYRPMGGGDQGAVYVLFLNTGGTVKNAAKLSDGEGGFPFVVGDDIRFGGSVIAINDLDGDSVNELVVGAEYDDDGGNNRGAVHVLFLKVDGTVKSSQKISDVEGTSEPLNLGNGDSFGVSMASMGDLNGDDVNDIAVGASLDDGGGNNRGAVYVLFIQAGGTVKSFQHISDTDGGLDGVLADGDFFA